MVPEGGLDPWGITTKQVSKPVVMATRGTCFTLGVELALASDVVIAATDSRFAQLEVSRGIMPFGGGTIRFPKVAGHANAMRYLLTGDSFDAQQALAMHLVTQVCEPGQEFETALEIAKRVASQAPLAVQETLASARAIDSEQEKKAGVSATGLLDADKGRCKRHAGVHDQAARQLRGQLVFVSYKSKAHAVFVGKL